jgi:hypothetical protein
MKVIVDSLGKLGLSAEDFLVGQGYDGGSNMSGEFKGVAARIRAKIPQAVYIHCHAHRLNLALQDALEEHHSASNVMAIAAALHNFFDGSYKRKSALKDDQQANHNGTTTTKRLDTTRWGSRQASFSSILKTIKNIITCLNQFSDTKTNDAKTASKAFTLLRSVEDFHFQFVLRALAEVFERTGKLSETLQSSDLEMDRCEREVQSALDRLMELRTDEEFQNLYQRTIDFASEEELDMPEKPRVSNSARHRVEEFATPEDRFKSIYFEIIDSVVKEIKARLHNDSKSYG